MKVFDSGKAGQTNQGYTPLAAKIVGLLLPYVRTEGARMTALTMSWGIDHPDLYDIDVSLTPRDFAVQFVVKTLQVGQRGDGVTAIDALLDYLASQVGEEQQMRIAETRALIRKTQLQNNPWTVYRAVLPFEDGPGFGSAVPMGSGGGSPAIE